jgi:threonylcarbamoyladenosine tRNA methylthiotransferase MtaB
MRRRYRATDFAGLVDRIRSAIPGVAVTTDVMVGFPGETDAEFETSRAFVESLDFAAIHVFPYSVRRRTSASKFPDQASSESKKRRTEIMLGIATKSACRFRVTLLDSVVSVLYEGEGKDGEGTYWEGLTDNYVRVRAYSGADLSNQICSTRVVSVSSDLTRGELVLAPPPRSTRRSTEARIPLRVLSSASR